MDNQSYRGRDRYRDRSTEPPVRRRSLYSPETAARTGYRQREDERRFRGGYQYRRREGGRRFSRFDSRESPTRRTRRGRSSSNSRSRSPSPRRNYNYRARRDGFPDNRSRQRADSRERFSRENGSTINNHDTSNVSHQTPYFDDNQFSNPAPIPATPTYQNLPGNPAIQPFQQTLMAEQNHIPPAAHGQQYYPPPQFNASSLGNFPTHQKPPEKKGPDEDVVRKILDNLKSKGVVDKFRKTFLEECDEKPDFKRLSDRVTKTVTSFLKTRTWLPEINKNTERQLVRRRVLESSYFAEELNGMLDRCFAEAESYFMPEIQDCVHEFLGIEKPKELAPTDSSKEENLADNEDEAAEIDVEGEEGKESEAEDDASVNSGSASSGSSYMDVDSTEGESDSEVTRVQFSGQLPPPPPLPMGSYYPSLLPGQFAVPSFDRISHLVPNHPPPPPLPRPLGFGRHIPILSNTIMMRNPVDNPPLPPTDDDEPNENPPPPSEEDTSSDSESEEISVGKVSPIIESPGPKNIDSEDDTEESPKSSPVEESENPMSPAVDVDHVAEFTMPREIPLSPRTNHIDSILPVEGENFESSEDSPQPPPPGEEDISLPLFSDRFSMAHSENEIFEQHPSPVDASFREHPPLPPGHEQEIPLPPSGIPPPPPEFPCPPSGIPLPPSEIPPPPPEIPPPEIPLPPVEDPPAPPEIPLPLLENPHLSPDINNKILLPTSGGTESVGIHEFENIPLPADLEEGELDLDIPLPNSAGASPKSPDEYEEEMHSDIPMPEERSADSPRSITPPLPPADRGIPLLPSSCEDAALTFPNSSNSNEVFVAGLCEDLSPVTSGDLDDISDDSLTEIAFPNFDQSQETDYGKGQTDTGDTVECKILVSPTMKTEDVELKKNTPLTEPIHSNTPIADKLSFEVGDAEVNKNVLDSPQRIDLQNSHSQITTEEFYQPRSLADYKQPPLQQTHKEVGFDTTNPELPPSPAPLQIFEEPTLPPPRTLVTVNSTETTDDNVFEEDDDEWESPAFEKFGETSPPRIDHVEKESFENLVHISPEKRAQAMEPTEGRKDKHRDRRRSSHHHRSSRRRETSKEREHRTSSRSAKTSEIEKDARKSEGSSREKSRTSSRSKSESSSSRTKRRSEGDGLSGSKSSKREDKKDDRHSSRSHRHSSGKSRKERDETKSSRSTSDTKDGSPSSANVISVSDSSTLEAVQDHQKSIDKPNLVEAPKEAESNAIEASTSSDKRGSTLYLEGEEIDVLQYLEALPTLLVKMNYYSKYTDPLLMDEEVSLDSCANFDAEFN